MKIVILLTTTINPQNHISWLQQRDKNERQIMYENIIKLWLEKTNFKIVVIENSGSKFNIKPNPNRLEIISFSYPEEDKEILEKMEAKGQHEMYSIQYAINNSKFIKEDNYDYLIKITGRYFIPKLELILNYLLNYYKNQNIIPDYIRQSQKWRNMNRCEIVGCHRRNILNLFKFPLEDDMMEKTIMDRMNNNDKNNNNNNSKIKLNLPKLKLHKPTKQGVGKLLNYL